MNRVLEKGNMFYCAVFDENEVIDHFADFFKGEVKQDFENKTLTFQNEKTYLNRYFKTVDRLIYDEIQTTSIDDLVQDVQLLKKFSNGFIRRNYS